MPLIGAMKPVSLRKSPAPPPRFTLWVPLALAAALSLLWLGLLAVIALRL